jgi:23S rRNA pseudouridine2605 synthase
MRLDKWLAQHGEFSRSEATKAIRRKKVTLDGVVCNSPKSKVLDAAEVHLDGVLIERAPVLLAFHKPVGLVTTVSDPRGRPCVGDWLPHRYHIVGRLDLETHGLLLFSRDGSLTQHLLHPKRGFEREYVVKVEGAPSFDLIQRLANGIETSVGLAKAHVVSINADVVRLIVTEGRNRVVRRMLHNAGHSVLDLQRVRYGLVELGTLVVGQTRPLTDVEMGMFSSLG